MIKHLLRRVFPEPPLTLAEGCMPRRLALLDIGARGGLQWPWSRVSRSLLEIVLVEPDPVEAARLTSSGGGDTVLPAALWRDNSVLTLRVNRSGGTSSIFEPNRRFLDQFPEAERFDTVKSVELPARTVDGEFAAGRLGAVDFAKIDVQGAELAILEGGVTHFADHLIGLEVEVEFAPMYEGQPLFGDVDGFIRHRLGLELWDLRRAYWKYLQGAGSGASPKGRLIFGDALYFRPLDRIPSWLERSSRETAAGRLAALLLAVLAYGYVDYARALLADRFVIDYLDGPTKSGFQAAAMECSRGVRPFVRGHGPAWELLSAFAAAVRPAHNGWAIGDQWLGARRRGPFWR